VLLTQVAGDQRSRRPGYPEALPEAERRDVQCVGNASSVRIDRVTDRVELGDILARHAVDQFAQIGLGAGMKGEVAGGEMREPTLR
jgi:hypothetical protein